MATTTDYLTQLQADKQTLVTNLVAKGVEADNSETFTTLAPKVADIQTGDDGEWKRPSDWWDTKSILRNAENITLDDVIYYPRYIVLLNNYCDSSVFNIRNFAYFSNAKSYPVDGKFLLKTSDGSTYKSTTYAELSSSITHTWDKTKDKPYNNTKDYYNGTRYLMLYCNNKDTPIQYYNTFGSNGLHPSSNDMSTQVIEIIFGEGTFLEPYTTTWASGGTYYPNLYLENFETFDTTVFDEITTSEYTLKRLSALKHFYLPTLKRMYGPCFYSTYTPHLTKISLPNLEYGNLNLLSYIGPYQEINLPKVKGNDTASTAVYNIAGGNTASPIKKIVLSSLVSNLGTVLSGAGYYLDNLEYFDLSSYIEPNLVFTTMRTPQLNTLVLADGFKKTGVSLVNCKKLTKACLLDIINKLADVTEETETTYTIILGAINLAKLTEEEIAIATAKGWTVS